MKSFKSWGWWFLIGVRDAIALACIIILIPIWVPIAIAETIWEKYKAGTLGSYIFGGLKSGWDWISWVFEGLQESLPTLWTFGAIASLAAGSIPQALGCLVMAELIQINRHMQYAEIITREED